eukprot:363393-Chlamydomonas_euryale.AAC.4
MTKPRIASATESCIIVAAVYVASQQNFCWLAVISSCKEADPDTHVWRPLTECSPAAGPAGQSHCVTGPALGDPPIGSLEDAVNTNHSAASRVSDGQSAVMSVRATIRTQAVLPPRQAQSGSELQGAVAIWYACVKLSQPLGLTATA